MFKILFGIIAIFIPEAIEMSADTDNIIALIGWYSIISGIETILTRRVNIKIANIINAELNEISMFSHEAKSKIDRLRNEADDYYHQLKKLLSKQDDDDYF